MQTVGPTATFHDTASLLVNNLNLVVDNHIVNILFEHCVCLKQLVYSVDTFRLY